MAKTKAERESEIHQQAIVEFDSVYSAVREERLQSVQDRRFYSIAGAQWEGPLGEEFANKPKFEVNKIHLSVIRIINEYRNNRITVNFASRDGSEDDDLSDLCNGLYRSDEADSSAEEAYDNAFEEAVGGGFGAWRLSTQYEDDEDPDSDEQRIIIEPIYDADSSVFFDLQAKKQDKSNAKRCWVLESYTHDAFEEEFGHSPSSWTKEIHNTEFDWYTPDVVYVAEYFKVELKKEIIHIWEFLDGEEKRYTSDEIKDPAFLAKITAIGGKEVRTKKLKVKRIHKYILSGAGVEEDCGILAGKMIPVIPVYGKRWFVDNVERCMGHVRLAKDVQRLKNMQLSKLGMISALSSVEKPILTPEQIAGHQLMWSEDNIKDYPYLLINPITDVNGQEAVAGPVGYTKASSIPPAMAALLQITEEDIQDLLGNQQDGEEIQGNVSTETASLVQSRLDMQTYIYMSNFAKAVKRSGEVWLSMSKDVVVEQGRMMKLIGSQGDVSHAELMKPGVDEDGAVIVTNDLSKAKQEVTVDVGPSSSTKKAGTVRALIKMMSVATDPETLQVLSAMVMMNMEGEGIGDVRGYFRNKLIRMGAVEPNDEEKKKLKAEAEAAENAEPSPQDQYLEAAAANETAKSVESQAKTILTQAKADNTQADTIKIMADIEMDESKLALEAIEKLGPSVSPPDLPGSKVTK